MSTVSREQLSHTMRTRAFWIRFCIFVVVLTVVMQGLIWLCNETLDDVDPVWAFGIRFAAASCLVTTSLWFFVRRVAFGLARKQSAGKADGRHQQTRA